MRKRVFGMIMLIAGICLMLPLQAVADTVSGNGLVETVDEESVSEDEIEGSEETVSEDESEEGNREETVSEDENAVGDGEQTVSENDIVEDDEETTSEEEETESPEYNEAVLAEKNTLQNYYVYKSQLNAQRMKLKLEYLTAMQEEWAQRLRIEEKKLELGYSTKVAVEEIQCQYDSVQLQIEEANALQEYHMECIALYEGEYEEISVPEEWTALSEDYVEIFKADSTQKMSYQEQIDEYKELLEFVGAETEYGSEIEKQLQLAELNLKQYEMNLKAYVKQLQLQHQNIGRNVQQSDNQIALIKTKIKNAKLLLDKGKITKIELIGLENELKRVEFERTGLLYDAQLIYHILNNTIENQSI